MKADVILLTSKVYLLSSGATAQDCAMLFYDNVTISPPVAFTLQDLFQQKGFYLVS